MPISSPQTVEDQNQNKNNDNFWFELGRINGLTITGRTTAPTVTDDIGQQHDVGTLWVDETSDKIYLCADSSRGAAVWLPISNNFATTTRVTTTPYNATATDHILFVDTDGGAITVNLPAGIEGKNYKVINCGSSGNDVTLDPNGTEEIWGGGAGVAFALIDGDNLDIHYNEGWW